MPLQPTQITTLLMLGNIWHGFIKQNHLLMAAGLSVYTTSLLYHFTKFDFPYEVRTQRPIFEYDILACIFLFLAGLCEGHRTYVSPKYYKILLAFHIFNPIFFAVTSYYKVAVWSEDPWTAELWHAGYHLFTQFQIHLFLFVYEEYKTKDIEDLTREISKGLIKDVRLLNNKRIQYLLYSQ